MDFGKMIKERRLALGLTLEQVGEMCGVSKATVLKWEHGLIRNVRRDKLVLLSKALHLSPADLIDTEGVTLVSATLPADGITLTDEEKLLVLAYRDATQETRDIIMKILEK